MKFRHALFSASLCASLAIGMALIPPSTPIAAPSAADAYDIDPGHSTVMFRAKHLGVSYSYGRFNEFAGQFTLDSAKPENSKVSVEIKTASVDSNDEKRDGHLKSPDFFDAKQFPTSTFTSTSVKKGKDGHYAVTGDFTLRGVTKPVTLDIEEIGSVKDPRFGERTGFHGMVTIKRSEFGVNYMPEGLGEDVLITISVEGVKRDAGKPEKK